VPKPSADKVLPGNNLWQSQWGKTLCQSLVQTRFCLEATPLAEPMGQDLVPKPGADCLRGHRLGTGWVDHMHQGLCGQAQRRTWRSLGLVVQSGLGFGRRGALLGPQTELQFEVARRRQTSLRTLPPKHHPEYASFIKAICRHPLWEEWAMNANTHQQALVASPPYPSRRHSRMFWLRPPPETTQAMNTFPAKAVPCKAPTGTRACALQPRGHHVVFRHCKTWTSKNHRFSW